MVFQASATTLVLALLVSGCAGAGAPADDTVNPTAPSPSGPTSGSGPAMGPGASGAAPAPATVRWEAFPIAWDGKMGRNLCLPSGVNSCDGVPEASTPGESSLFLEATGSVAWNLTISLAWTAATPATEQLTLSVLRFESCGQGCRSGMGVESRTGVSPLSLDLKGIRLEGNETGLWISVGVPRQTPSPVYAQATVEQEFRAEGSAVAKRMG